MVADPGEAIFVDFLPESNIEDDDLVSRLNDIINEAYDKAEVGIFIDSHTRTNVAGVRELITSRQLVVAATCPIEQITSEHVRGCVRVAMLTETLGNLGTLCALSSRSGVGYKLVAFAETYCRDRGATKMQIELVVPTTFELPLKKWIQAWYERMGYKFIRDEDFTKAVPSIASHVITPTVFRIFQKDLVALA